MDTMISIWTVVDQVRVASGAAELAIFTAILYWFFTSSRVADMIEVVGERVGSWCGRDAGGSLHQAMLARRRQHHADMYSKLDADIAIRTSSLYRVKEGPVVPAPQPQSRPPTGLACGRCAPLSRESWKDPKIQDSDAVINVLDIGKLTNSNGGVVSRLMCDITQNIRMPKFDYKDVAPSVEKDEIFLKAIDDMTQEEMKNAESIENASGEEIHAVEYETVRRRVEARARKVLRDISSAMSNNVLRFVGWVTTKTIRRVAGGGCGTRWSGLQRLRRANAAGLPLVFVPLHRSHFDYVLVTFALFLAGLRPPLVAAGDNMRIPFFGWFLRGCGAFYIRRRVDGSEYHGDPIYKSALRSYILNSLSQHNNLEFFIEGGRTRTGKPQPPKAGILSVIMDAYLDNTIDDALLVPVTLNYDRLVDGNFVREQLGMPKQMETFWSALRGIWRTLNTNHGSIRVDYHQPISLKELVTSFQKYNHYKTPIESPLSSPTSDLALNLDRQILYHHSHSSLYGEDVSTDHKIMVEAIGRHLVYDASKAMPLMCTDIVAYVLLTERRRGCSGPQLQRDVASRAEALHRAGRDLAHAYNSPALTRTALDLLGRGLVRREAGPKQWVRPQSSIPACLELSYYANSVVVHYAAPAILATAVESLVLQDQTDVVVHSELMAAALRLCEILSEEFILCPPCQRIEDRMLEALDELVASSVLRNLQSNNVLEEEAWSRRFAQRLEEENYEEEDRPDPGMSIKYKVSNTPEAIAERRRLVVSIRPLLEAYAGTCRVLTPGTYTQKDFTKQALDHLTERFIKNNMIYGEAVSTDAIRNCLRLLRRWGVVELFTENKQRKVRVCPPYDDKKNLDTVCYNVYKFNMDTPLLGDED